MITLRITNQSILPQYKPLFVAESGIFFLFSGRGSTKTSTAVRRIFVELINNYDKANILLLRLTEKSVTGSVLLDLKLYIQKKLGENDALAKIFNEMYEVQQYGVYKKKRVVNGIEKYGYQCVTISGFQPVKKDDLSKFKGTTAVSLVVLEEMESLVDKDKMRTLLDSLREEKLLTIVIMNVTNTDHFFIQDYFDLDVENAKNIGSHVLYPIKLSKKAQKSGYHYIYTSYLDNYFLSERAKIQYDRYADEESPDYDLLYYYNAIMGYALKGSVYSYFNLNKQNKKEYLKHINTQGGHIRIYRTPTNTKYFAGLDTSTGQSDDYTALTIFDFYTGELVACANYKQQELESATTVYNICQLYDFPLLCVERNYTGRIVIRSLIEDVKYPLYKLYVNKQKNAEERRTQNTATKIGFDTTSVSRMLILSESKNAINQADILLNDDKILEEHKRFINQNGKWEAQSGYNDDYVMSVALANEARRYMMNNNLT